MKRPIAHMLPCSAGPVTLRRLAVADLAAFQAYRQDPELGRYQGWSPMSDVEATAFLSEMSSAPLFLPGFWSQVGISEISDPSLIGDIGLFLAEDSRHVEVGFTLQRQSQGRGIASAAVREAIRLAFEQTGADRVLGITDARNAACVRLLERLGMRRTETKDAVFRGESCVEYIYAIERGAG